MGIDQVTLAELRSRYGAREARLAEAAIDVIAGADGLEAVTAHRLQEFLWRTLPGWRIDDPERVAAALGHLFTLTGLDRYADLATCARTRTILAVYAGQGADAGREACEAAITESGLVPPDTPLLAWRVFTGPEEHAARHACAATLELAVAAGELRPGARGWERVRAAVTNRCLTAPRRGGPWLDRVHAERLDAWTRPVNPRKAALLRAAADLLREPVPPAPEAFGPLRWLLTAARDGLPLTERHYIVPRLVTEAVNLFGWREELVGTLTREFDVPPLSDLRELATREMKAIRRTGRTLVLTPLGRRMLADDRVFWDVAVQALIGRGSVLALTTREIMLTLLLVHDPAPVERLEQRTIDVLAQEWDTPTALPAEPDEDRRPSARPGLPAEPAADDDLTPTLDNTTPGGLADAVARQRIALRRRLWALDCHRPERRFGAPFTLTPHGETAARAALRAHALRPHPPLK
ncbi:hypothetical protein AB0K60_08775 [Thermopolyspora sp. NPDC052614]|uniref:hypothetical protein n=1 Tax=Thermopolyspora sp. NPDC052614 TaxID=3155682 RepID=UPI0034432724